MNAAQATKYYQSKLNSSTSNTIRKSRGVSNNSQIVQQYEGSPEIVRQFPHLQQKLNVSTIQKQSIGDFSEELIGDKPEKRHHRTVVKGNEIILDSDHISSQQHRVSPPHSQGLIIAPKFESAMLVPVNFMHTSAIPSSTLISANSAFEQRQHNKEHAFNQTSVLPPIGQR